MVRFERTIHAASDAIWSVLTDTQRLPGWYGEGQIEGRVGGAVSLMGGHIRGTEPREAYMRRNAERYGVELPKRPT